MRFWHCCHNREVSAYQPAEAFTRVGGISESRHLTECPKSVRDFRCGKMLIGV